jgi:hypothetical protein
MNSSFAGEAVRELDRIIEHRGSLKGPPFRPDTGISRRPAAHPDQASDDAGVGVL